MCGIVGVFGSGAEEREARLEQACAPIHHRGTDEDRLWASRDAAFGGRRSWPFRRRSAGRKTVARSVGCAV